jgi:hypothetical protein
VDPISGGILDFLACAIAAIVLGVGFTAALCRGARKERRERAG